MERRYHLQNDTQMIEFEHTANGYTDAQVIRRIRPEFRRRKIRDVIQVHPERIELGRIYEMT